MSLPQSVLLHASIRKFSPQNAHHKFFAVTTSHSLETNTTLSILNTRGLYNSVVYQIQQSSNYQKVSYTRKARQNLETKSITKGILLLNKK